MNDKLLEEDIFASYFKISKSPVDLDLSESLHRYWEIISGFTEHPACVKIDRLPRMRRHKICHILKEEKEFYPGKAFGEQHNIRALMGKHFHVQFVQFLNGECLRTSFWMGVIWQPWKLEEEKEKQEEGIQCRRAVENMSDVFVFQFRRRFCMCVEGPLDIARLGRKNVSL